MTSYGTASTERPATLCSTCGAPASRTRSGRWRRRPPPVEKPRRTRRGSAVEMEARAAAVAMARREGDNVGAGADERAGDAQARRRFWARLEARAAAAVEALGRYRTGRPGAGDRRRRGGARGARAGAAAARGGREGDRAAARRRRAARPSGARRRSRTIATRRARAHEHADDREVIGAARVQHLDAQRFQAPVVDDVVEPAFEGVERGRPAPGRAIGRELGQRALHLPAAARAAREVVDRAAIFLLVEVADDHRRQAAIQRLAEARDLLLVDRGRREVAGDEAAAVADRRPQVDDQHLQRAERRVEHQAQGRKPAVASSRADQLLRRGSAGATSRRCRPRRRADRTPRADTRRRTCARSDVSQRLVDLLQEDDVGLAGFDRRQRRTVAGDAEVHVVRHHAQRRPRPGARRLALRRVRAAGRQQRDDQTPPGSPAPARATSRSMLAPRAVGRQVTAGMRTLAPRGPVTAIAVERRHALRE